MDGNGCVIWTNVWVPTLIPKNFFERPFLGGLWAFEELKKSSRCTTEDRLPIIEADSIEQYGRRENVRIFGVQEEPGEDVFAKVVSVAEKAGVLDRLTEGNHNHRWRYRGISRTIYSVKKHTIGDDLHLEPRPIGGIYSNLKTRVLCKDFCFQVDKRGHPPNTRVSSGSLHLSTLNQVCCPQVNDLHLQTLLI